MQSLSLLATINHTDIIFNNCVWLGFINFIVNPLFDIFGEVIDKISQYVVQQGDVTEFRKTDSVKPWIQPMRDNHEKWLRQCHDSRRPSKAIGKKISGEYMILL